MTQTAIEWLENQIKTSKYFYKLMEDINSRSTIAQSNIFEEAKEMEKKQIIDGYQDGYNDHFFTYGNGDENDDQEGSIDGPIYKSPAHYYKKLYKKKD